MTEGAIRLSQLPVVEAGDAIYSACANTQTAERLCVAINACAQAHNLYPWSVARRGPILYVVSKRKWEPTEDERRAADLYLKRVWPEHPRDISRANDTEATFVRHTLGQDTYRRRQPASGAALAEAQVRVATARRAAPKRAGIAPPRPDSPPAPPMSAEDRAAALERLRQRRRAMA